MQPQKAKITFLVCWYFLLHQQRALLLHQAYHFLIVEEEFRIRQRNERWAMFMFFSQMNQQNEQRWQRRAWLQPHSQNWFLNLLANLEHFGKNILEWHTKPYMILIMILWGCTGWQHVALVHGNGQFERQSLAALDLLLLKTVDLSYC